MTLRFEAPGKPIGLDWTACNDGSNHPEVWKNWQPPKPKEPSFEPEPRPAPKRLARTVEQQVIRMYRDDLMSALQVGAEIGIQPATVFKVLRRNGVPTRSRSESMRLSRAKRAA